MVSCLKMIGREADARKLLHNLLLLRNDLGLLAEEYDTTKQRQVGNFPQAFSHIAMVNAIFDLQGHGKLRVRHDRRTRPEDITVPASPNTPELDPEPTAVSAPPGRQGRTSIDNL